MNDVRAERPPILFVLSGPSGVGKDSVIGVVRAAMPDLYVAVTSTTRAPRRGEVHGKSYYFLAREEYERLLDRHELLAPAEVHGNWYGAPLGPIREAFREGRDVLLKIDVQGAIQVRRRIPQAVFIFLAPPSMEVLVQRLTARQTEMGADLERRLADARSEMAELPAYDYLVVNDEISHAAHGVTSIVTAERLRLHRQPIELPLELPPH